MFVVQVFDQGKLIFFVASRGHHAEIGGITPGRCGHSERMPSAKSSQRKSNLRQFAWPIAACPHSRKLSGKKEQL